ncbi:MAG: U4/U6.U5 tri-snRNP-associated protein 1 [Paramarteilia canceri]
MHVTSAPQSVSHLVSFAAKQGLLNPKTKQSLDASKNQTTNSSSINNELFAKNAKKIKVTNDDLEAKFLRGDRFKGRSVSFEEKNNYEPNVQLAYYDDFGREVKDKEAFKLMSHKFHGRWPGKRKEEKKIRKIEGQHLTNYSTLQDTPLHTVEKMRKKQKSDQSAFILLSKNNKIAKNPE